MRQTAGIPRIGAINRSHPLAKGLVSCWRAMPDMERGTKWRDLAGKNDGTLTNGPTWRSDGLSFDGSNDYEVASDAGFPLGTASRTMAAWVRVASIPGGDGGALCYGTAGSAFRASELYIQGSTGRAAFTNYSSAGAVSSASVADNKWHMIVGTTVGSLMTLYVDGAFAASVTEPTDTLSTGSVYFARDSIGAYLSFTINDARIYNRALSATEVKSLYRDPLGIFNRTRVPVGRVAAATTSKIPVFRHHYVSQGIG